MERDPLTELIIGCAIEVNQAPGPGLPESAYERCMAYELAHLLTYMKLARIRTGLLINFNQLRLVDGLRRFKL
jgi:hypothetical protein